MSGEATSTFACFGGTVSLHIRDADEDRARELVERCTLSLLDAHRLLTRFDPESELCRLNRDPREVVPASALLRQFAAAVRMAGIVSDGLVDATLIDSIERAGYTTSLVDSDLGDRPNSFEPAVRTRPGGPSADARWRSVVVDRRNGTVVRPPGLRIDSGGLAKGLLADVLATGLDRTSAYAIDCCGDIRIGGSAKRPRRVRVGDPFREGTSAHEFQVIDGAVATSGISRRHWVGDDGAPAHHLIDPSSGRPAYTGVVQATAFAPTALLAEIHAKAALLAGPEGAASRLPGGGLLVLDDRTLRFVEASGDMGAVMA